MYGIVLMAAMTAGGEAPDFGRRCSCSCSCSSCYSSCKSSCRCSCSCKSSCRSSCKCSCSSCSSCKRSKKCSCSCSCYSSCHSSCTVVYSGCYAPAAPVYAAPVIEAAPIHHAAPVISSPAPVISNPVVPMNKAIEGGKIIDSKPVSPKKLPDGKNEASLAAPASLFVTLPAEAKLTIDGDATTSVSTERVFVSPTLEAGKTYTYTLQAEFARDGKAVVVSKDVKVSAGATVNVSLFEAVAAR